MKQSSKGYVEIQVRNNLFSLDFVKVVPTGKLNDKGEAEGICITPRSGLQKVWFTREDIVV